MNNKCIVSAAACCLAALLSSCTVSKTYTRASKTPGMETQVVRDCEASRCHNGYCTYGELRKDIENNEGAIDIVWDVVWETVKAPFTIPYDLFARSCKETAVEVAKDRDATPASTAAAPADAGTEILPAPKGAANPDAVAVIIGVRSYRNADVPRVEYALNDAQAWREYAAHTLGVPKSNILYLADATKGDLERVFGNADVLQGQLYNMLKPGKSDIFVFYSGHGAPDASGGAAYLVPADGDPGYVRVSGYPLSLLYKNLNALPAKSVTVALDACFSGGSGGGTLLKQASPLVLVPENVSGGAGRINLMVSASGSQIASWYPQKQHGLFTYYLLKELKAQAGGGAVSFGGLMAPVSEEVASAARGMYGREQTPQFAGDRNAVFFSK